MQNELEEVTEKLSEMIARPYLRTPKSVIIQTSALARRKRHEFVRAVEQGLIPPETPPMLRKRKKRCLDSDLSQTSSWLKDCEWPEYDTDEETDMGVTHKTFPCTCKSPIKDHQRNLVCSKNCGKGSDYNMELIIALEMSRLQMIEDRMKQQTQLALTPDPSSNTSNESSSDDQLKLAIQLSLQESTAAISKQLSKEKSSAEITVDYFLKSLANHSIDLRTIEKWKEHDNIQMNLPCSGNADGTFQISDIHDNGYAFEDMDNDYECNVSLKRSHSTGDLCVRRSGRARVRTNIEEPRYHLDSDHSSQHEDKPEDVVRRLMALPASVRNKQFLLLHTSYPEEDSQGQSSVEDTTTSDSINVDHDSSKVEDKAEKSEITNYDDETKKTEKSTIITECKKQTHNSFSSLKSKLCSGHLPKASCLSKLTANKSGRVPEENNTASKSDSNNFEKSKSKLKEDGDKKFVIISECKSEKQSPKKHHKNCRKNIFSKSTGFLMEEQQKATRGLSSNLRIQICDSPLSNNEYCLETDSSNEYESETGIPKSPTLFISGVSISRTPEPKSSGMSLIQAGRSSRSSSFSIPLPLSSCSLSISSTSLNNTSSLPPEPYTPSLIKSCTPISSRSNLHTPSTSPSRSNNENGKTRSANEPEREREMFRFPKSSTDGALSSVLHVQESNLSSDDFHEALFLLERTPQVRDSKRRKKSKKREKDDKKEDQSSVL